MQHSTPKPICLLEDIVNLLVGFLGENRLALLFSSPQYKLPYLDDILNVPSKYFVHFHSNDKLYLSHVTQL